MSAIKVETLSKSAKVMHPSSSRSFVFETERQRNTSFLQKGITKPGQVTYETLRRAANSVHVARICINTLKQKVTKTKWVIQPKDPLARKKKDDAQMQARIKRVTNLLKYPNTNSEKWRSLLDKMLEDLLVLDAVSLEKTRYADGSLAELHFVDSATIRPVFDEHGNQDVEIPLIDTAHSIEEQPVSYVQVMDNSQYGGPESGHIIAAWSKKDFIHFHAHPQGSITGIGYGLSPIESVLSVVANLLNADNYNGTYFEEGSLPPILLQIVGQMNQRDIEALKEYLNQELGGNFHRPMVMAGQQEAKVLNLKDNTNLDMQFMEYMKFLARLLAAAYGLSGQDIGLTDEVGSKNVSETQKDISDSKGYTSILALIKEQINDEIIWKDFQYEDLEFEWIEDDTQDKTAAMDMYDKGLKNGIYTLNEIRQMAGQVPFPDWADEPKLLTATGYIPLDPEANDGNIIDSDPLIEENKEEKTDDTQDKGGEKESSDEKDEGSQKAPVKKSLVQRLLRR